MKTFLISLISFCLLSVASAFDLAACITSLGGDDDAARLSARNDLMRAFSEATTPGQATTDLSALETSVIPHAAAAALPLAERLYLIRMLELFGSATVADALSPLLGDGEAAVRDSVRRALSAIPGEQAKAHLLAGLTKGTGTESAAYLDALAARGDAGVAPALTKYLQSPDPVVVAAATLALGKLGNPAVKPALWEAHQNSAVEVKALVETALLQIGVDMDHAHRLAKTGLHGVTRAEAFTQLIPQDATRAGELLQDVLAQPEFPGRVLMLQSALKSESAVLREAVLAQLSGGGVDDQLVIVTTIGELGLPGCEQRLLAILPGAQGSLRAELIHALGNIGGDASFDILYQAVAANSRDQNAANALARLKAPSLDQKVLATVEQGTNTAERIAGINVLKLRNTAGAAALLNRMIEGDVDPSLQEAAFTALEFIGDDESIRSLLSIVTDGGEQQRAAQRSLKRLSLNFGAPEYQWEKFYHPALESAANDSEREAILQILDAVACRPMVAYLKEILLGPGPSPLLPAAVSVFARLPLEPSLQGADVWLTILSAESSTDDARGKAVAGLQKMLTHGAHNFYPAQADLIVKIIQGDLPLERKRELLSGYDDPAKHFFVGRKNAAAFKRLKVVETDPEFGELIRTMTGTL